MAVATLAATGCGGSNAQTSSQAGGTAQTSARVNAVCSVLAKEIARLSEEHDLLKALREAVVVSERADAEVRVILTHTSEPRATEWLHLHELAVADAKKSSALKATAEEVKRYSDAEEPVAERARQLAKAHGLTACDTL